MELLKNGVKYFAFLILSLCLSISCSKKDPDIVARVGTRLITVQEFEQEFAKGKTTQSVRNATVAEKSEFLDKLINDKLKIIEGIQQNLHKDKEILNQITEQERITKLKRLVEKEVIEKIIPESELREIHDRFSKEVKISQIVIKFDRNNAEQKSRALKRAEEIVNRLNKKESFEKVAEATSEDLNTSQQGGRKGYLKWGIVSSQDPIYAAAFSMKRNEISDPIETNDAYVIIKIDDIRTYPARPFELAREKLRYQVYSFRRSEINEGYYKYLDDLRKKHNVKFDAKNLELFWTKLNQRPDSLTETQQSFKEASSVAAKFSEIEKKRILASYDDGWITINELIAELEKFPARRRPQFKDVFEVQEFINNYRDLVPLRLIELEAKRKNISNDAEFLKTIATERDRIILNKMRRLRVDENLTVSPDDLRSYFEQHREDYKNPEMRDVQQIYVRDKQRAETVAASARRGADFTRLFDRYNESEALKKENNQGRTQMSRGRAVLGNIVFNMQINDISDPVKLGDGFYVVKLLAINEPTLQTFEEAENAITPKVRNIIRDKKQAEWEAELRSRINFVVYKHNLEQAGKNFVGDDVVLTE